MDKNELSADEIINNIFEQKLIFQRQNINPTCVLLGEFEYRQLINSIEWFTYTPPQHDSEPEMIVGLEIFISRKLNHLEVK